MRAQPFPTVPFALALLMLSMSLATLLAPPASTPDSSGGELAGPPGVFGASLNSTETVTISSHPNGISNSFKLDIAEGEAVRSIGLELSPKVLPRSEGLSFTDPSDFNQSGAISQGVDYNTSGLSVSAIDEYWSFEGSSGLPSGWSTTNGNYGLINTMSCGTNGSSSRSLTLRHGTVTVTSNVIDLSALSQGIMALWMTEGRSGCGEDPDSSEHLYVEYKRSSGSWGQITFYNAGLGYPGYTNRNDQFNLPSDAFHSNFQFRFRLPYGSGTCCDWWFVDDVRLTKPGGLGNWTSPVFGPNATNSNYRSLPGPYGMMSIDSDAAVDAVSWSVLDGSTQSPIHGFEGRMGRWADLGGIDWQKHPAIRLKVSLAASGTGSMTIVNGIYIQGIYANSFDESPPDWNLNGVSWDGDSLTGSGSAVSPTFLSRRPISRIAADLTMSGNGALEGSFDGGVWTALSSTGTTTLEQFAQSVQFRVSANGANFDLQRFKVDLEGGGLPTSPLIDIGLDGRAEWSIANSSIGTWGWQDVFEGGADSIDLTWSSGSQKTVALWLPRGSDGSITFEVSPHRTTGVSDLDIDLAVAGNTVASWSLGSPGESKTLLVQTNDKANLAAEISAGTAIWRQGGIEYVRAVLTLTADGGGVRIGGLAIPHQPTESFSYSSHDDFVMALNSVASTLQSQSGWVRIPITMSWELPGAMEVTLTELESDAALDIRLGNTSNLSSTLSPSWQWFEVGHNITVVNGGLTALQYDLVGTHNAVTYTVSLEPGVTEGVLMGDSDAIVLPESFHTGTSPSGGGGGGGAFPGVSGDLYPILKFSLNASWEDEEEIRLHLRGIMFDGLVSLPSTYIFGIGPTQGVENDILVRDWRVLNDQGEEIAPETSYLKAESNITVEVEIGFEDLAGEYAPRTGEVEVRLLENEVIRMQTTDLVQGLATFHTQTPMSTGNVTYAVEIVPLYGGADVTGSILSRSFEIDSVAPQVINQSVYRHDHLEPSITQTLVFELFDRPVLPTNVELMLWREWQDDSDGDGAVDAGEFVAEQLTLPSNMSRARGNYSFVFDDTYGLEGDLVAGYLSGADQAGNLVVDGGSGEPGDQLFVYQLKADEAPLVSRIGTSWDDGVRSWLHPTTTYGITIPFSEANGFSDLDSVHLNLAGNSIVDQLPVVWDASDGRCTSTSTNLQLVSCDVYPAEGDLDPFTVDMELRLSFKLEWTLPDEDDLRREPDIEVLDRAGQGDWLALPELRWRFSTELKIESETLTLELEQGTLSADGAWVAPGSDVKISGRVAFVPTGDIPEDELKVAILLSGTRTTVRTENGWWEADLRAPVESGPPIPLTFELTDLPPQARDVTDSGTSVLYLTVDGTPPTPVDVVGPRLSNEIPVNSLGSLTVELHVKELEQLDINSLQLHWRVVRGQSPLGHDIASGSSAVTLPGHNAAGSEIPVRATLDINSEVPAPFLTESLSLHIWLTGVDMVGHEMVSDVSFNSAGSPFASWQIQRLLAEFTVEDDDIIYSRTDSVEVGQTVMVSITVHNGGDVHGFAEISLEEVDADGGRRKITPVAASVGVSPAQSEQTHIDWVPTAPGHYHILVIMDGEVVAQGEVLNVVVPADTGWRASLEERGFTLQWLFILGLLLVILLSVIVVAMRSGGSGLDEWGDDEGEVAGEVESAMQAQDSQTRAVPTVAAAQYNPYDAAAQQQQQMTPEQIAAWQQWNQWQGMGQQQQGWNAYQQAQYEYEQQKR